jgi:Na+/H+ antiporter NhaD/arsenite permease-like protein
VVLLGIGAIIANIFGTTGASMILIRPFIRGNQWRFSKFHIVFFIFIVSNCGGALTPIGDPPLFIGYLRGVPFFWVFQALWYKWAIGIAVLLVMFYLFDRSNFRKQAAEERQAALSPNPIVFDGLQNLFFIFMILGAAFVTKPILVRELLMIAAAVGSYLTTKDEIHKQNNFNFHPIQEVAILFVAIFAAMVPALDWLSANASALGITTAGGFYWTTGSLSAVLDNTPTYLNFLSAAMGVEGMNVSNPAEVAQFAAQHADMLRTISIAAVFFGAMTYIGNGPNFMCKAIAEHEKVPTPSFVEYAVKYAIPYLAPVLIITYLLVVLL